MPCSLFYIIGVGTDPYQRCAQTIHGSGLDETPESLEIQDEIPKLALAP
jgi:hypothetical protein